MDSFEKCVNFWKIRLEKQQQLKPSIYYLCRIYNNYTKKILRIGKLELVILTRLATVSVYTDLAVLTVKPTFDFVVAAKSVLLLLPRFLSPGPF